jgi:hypothetical protein
MPFRKLPRTAFKPGNPGGPGRPPGARARLQELAIQMLHKDFAEHGEETIRRVRERKPEVYLASVVSLLPKQAQRLESPFADLSDEELEQLEQLLREIRAKTIKRLELVAGTALDANGGAEPNKSDAD